VEINFSLLGVVSPQGIFCGASDLAWNQVAWPEICCVKPANLP
jgi:hypothetical protein